jgi:sensor c-di-GMP phosphodiesterase-like protein
MKAMVDQCSAGSSKDVYLKRLPLDQLKIDKDFVRNVLTDLNDAGIAKMVIALAESLGLAVMAEGVKIEAHRDLLARHGCHVSQGFLFGRALPIEGFEAFARSA